MSTRTILVVAHAYRAETVQAAERAIRTIHADGAVAVLAPDDRRDLAAVNDVFAEIPTLGADVPLGDIDIAVVLGGDGTILRAVELVREGTAPVLGVNMGHVGFLAEIERDNLDEAVSRAVAGNYAVEERLALSVTVKDASGETITTSWALNEAAIEKQARERMIEVLLEIDRRPLASYGTDGVVIATPTGSTAYNFSAGGPVIWPSVQAIAVVPLAAHTLFSKPLVVGPEHAVAIELKPDSVGTAMLWCDGRRSFSLPSGARVVVRRSSRPVRLARLHPVPFTDRLVRKFHLPTEGWRGPGTGATTRSMDVIGPHDVEPEQAKTPYGDDAATRHAEAETL